MKFKIDTNYLVFFFFFSYFVIGLFITGDYPVTPDEPLHRMNGFISLKYISNLFFSESILFNELEGFPNLHTDYRKTYGVLFDLPLAFIEHYFINDIKNVFYVRHFLTFLIFFISTIYFYYLVKINLKKSYIALIGVLILVTTPRIFSHSFYNSRDILFLSFLIIASFYSLKLIKKFEYKTLLLSCLFCAFATNIRILGIYLPILTFFFYYFYRSKVYKINIYRFFIIYFSAYLIFLYLIWPFLWSSPFSNFFLVLKESSSYPVHWDFQTMYLGKYINPENLPWHYFFVWFGFTTPSFILLLIITGLYFFIKEYFNFFLKINFKREITLWKNDNQMTSLFFFLIFFIPVFLIICLNSTLYNGWRHMYFIYPSLIFLSLQTLIYFKENFNLIYFKSIVFVILLQVSFNINFIYKVHPVQNVFFNFFSKKYATKNLPLDYWGLGNKKTIDYLYSKNKNFSIGTSSYTNLPNLQYSKNSYNKKIQFNGTAREIKNKSDFIFTNYYYNKDPKHSKSYNIPSEYKSYYKLIIDDMLVNEVFKKNK